KELKPAYYFVKRAFGDIKVNIEERDGKLYIFGVNDTLRPIEGKIEAIFSTFKGQGKGRKEVEVEIPANSSIVLTSIPMGDVNKFEEFFYVILYDRKGFIVDRNEHFFAPFKHLNLPKAEILYSLEELDKEIFMLHLESDFLALWTALELDNAEWEDNYFNIYPKSKYNVIFKAPYSLKEVKENIEVNGFNLKRARKL
ncbi:MAG TPA: glycoside hydrolase family 2 protein, partial [Dictyoglomaceae bacterium]|nr:glycoside hydrolase family 2 protein [Dictyoglomaceae bacterium]